MPRPIRKSYERHASLRTFSEKACWFTGRYQHVSGSPWVTLTEIRLAPNADSKKLLVGHINLKRSLVAAHLSLTEVHHHKMVLFYATYATYKTEATMRGTLVLVPAENEPALQLFQKELLK